MVILYLVIGIIVGILSSMFGFGGGLVIVPVLFWLLPQQNVPPHLVMFVAVATSLAIMIINSANSTYFHHKRGNVIWGIFLKMSPFISVGALFGAFASGIIGGEILRYFFVGFLVYIILISFYKNDFFSGATGKLNLPSYPKLGFSGTMIGFLAVMLGIGGSVLTVPFLRRSNLRMVNAVALAVPLGLPTAIVGASSYVFLGLKHTDLPSDCFGFVHIPALIGMGAGGFLGVPLGSIIASKMPDHLFSKIYLGLLIIVVISMLIKF
jgi:uncharacterized protein